MFTDTWRAYQISHQKGTEWRFLSWKIPISANLTWKLDSSLSEWCVSMKKWRFLWCLLLISFIVDIRLYEDPLYASDVFIYDGTNFSTAHCAKFISILLKKILTVARISYPQRVAAMHVVNPPPIAEMVIKTMRPYLHEKIRNRVRQHIPNARKIVQFIFSSSCTSLTRVCTNTSQKMCYQKSSVGLKGLWKNWRRDGINVWWSIRNGGKDRSILSARDLLPKFSSPAGWKTRWGLLEALDN